MAIKMQMDMAMDIDVQAVRCPQTNTQYRTDAKGN